MAVLLSELEENGFYYVIGDTDEPRLAMFICTWVYIKPTSNGGYAFCEWSQYNMNYRTKNFPYVIWFPEKNPETGELEFSSFRTKQQLKEDAKAGLFDY